jgi:hypothetical protein
MSQPLIKALQYASHEVSCAVLTVVEHINPTTLKAELPHTEVFQVGEQGKPDRTCCFWIFVRAQAGVIQIIDVLMPLNTCIS